MGRKILFITTDQQRYDTLGCNGGELSRTPVLDGLARTGVHLSVDDFGTGYSSLSYLKALPVHEVKIDRFFIGNLDVDESRRRFVGGVIAFAERTGCTVVAEGVEREAELAFLPRPQIEVAALLPYDRGDLLSRVHENGEVLSVEHTGEGTLLTARVNEALAGELAAYAQIA